MECLKAWELCCHVLLLYGLSGKGEWSWVRFVSMSAEPQKKKMSD